MDTQIATASTTRAAAPMPEGCLLIEYGPGFQARVDGGAWQQPAGKHGKGGLMPKLARRLIAEGHAPETPTRVLRDGTKVWARDLPLSYWAEVSISEPDGMSPRMVRYTAMPKHWEGEEGAAEDGDAPEEQGDAEA